MLGQNNILNNLNTFKNVAKSNVNSLHLNTSKCLYTHVLC